MSEHRDYYIRGRSSSGENLAELLDKKYDFALLSSSWDSRCNCLCSCSDLVIDSALVIFPEETDSTGLRQEHDSALRNYLGARASAMFEIAGNTFQPESSWDNLYNFMINSGSVTFPVETALVDLSSACRYYTLGVISMLLRLGMAKKVHVFYSECTYKESLDEPIEFTHGRWERRCIPFLDGDINPASPDHWILSCGFEGLKTRKFVRRDEPDRVQLLMPDPGFNEQYKQRAYQESQILVDELGIDPDDILKAPAADAIAAWKIISESSDKTNNEHQKSYICSGTKPHSLGLALHALSSRNPAVYYIRPDSYSVVETEPTGRYWLYEIEDLSQLPL